MKHNSFFIRFFFIFSFKRVVKLFTCWLFFTVLIVCLLSVVRRHQQGSLLLMIMMMAIAMLMMTTTTTNMTTTILCVTQWQTLIYYASERPKKNRHTRNERIKRVRLPIVSMFVTQLISWWKCKYGKRFNLHGIRPSQRLSLCSDQFDSAKIFDAYRSTESSPN